jgi:hypothetical protein
MTEGEWLACENPDPMCRYLEKAHLAQRKPRLVAVAWCRRVPNRLPDTSLRTVLGIVECFADGLVGREQLQSVAQSAVEVVKGTDIGTALTTSAFYHAATAVEEAAHDDPDAPYTFRLTDVSRHLAHAAGYSVAPAPWDGIEHERRAAFRSAEAAERLAMAQLVREVFGNLFRPIAFSPEWRTDTAVALAQQIYESREFGAMPILADALQDAGCDNEDVLAHCRGAGPHVRGCWVVDLVLGKE